MNNHSTLVLANGATVDIPYISEAGAGWILKPDQARTEHDMARGLNKSFGRSTEGREASRLWRQEFLQAQFDKADWSPLLSHDYDEGSLTTPGGDGITLSVQDPILGWNIFRFLVTEPNRYRSDGIYGVSVTWEGAAIQDWYRNRWVTEAHPFAWKELYQATYSFELHQRNKIYDMAEAFASDPMAYVKQETLAELPWNFDEIPPLDWGQLKPIEHFLDDAQTFHIEVDKAHVFWRKGTQAQAVFVAATEEVSMLELAFQHLGIDVRIGEGMNFDIGPGQEGYRKDGLTSIVFSIPADAQDEHNQRGHTITVDLKTMSVRCGYVTDTLKWEAYKARQAADWLSEYEKETTPSYEEYDIQPN